jgi:hypothetical protein
MQSAPEPRGADGKYAYGGKVAADVGGWGMELKFAEDDSGDAVGGQRMHRQTTDSDRSPSWPWR